MKYQTPNEVPANSLANYNLSPKIFGPKSKASTMYLKQKNQVEEQASQPVNLISYNVPFIHYKAKKSPYTFVLFHANAEDIFDTEVFCLDLKEYLNVSIYAIEYAGYGL